VARKSRCAKRRPTTLALKLPVWKQVGFLCNRHVVRLHVIACCQRNLFPSLSNTHAGSFFLSACPCFCLFLFVVSPSWSVYFCAVSSVFLCPSLCLFSFFSLFLFVFSYHLLFVYSFQSFSLCVFLYVPFSISFSSFANFIPFSWSRYYPFC
jgi:hypothetical protein